MLHNSRSWSPLRALLLVSASLVVACSGDRGDSADTPTPTPAPTLAPTLVRRAAEAEACVHAPSGASSAAAACGDVSATQSLAGHYGAAFALPRAQALGAVASEATLPEGPVQVVGTIEAVCQKRGCWLVLHDGAARARVLMKDHAFTVPVDIRGKRARVEGTMARRTFSVAQARHLEHDAGRDGAAVTAPRDEVVIVATGVAVEDA